MLRLLNSLVINSSSRPKETELGMSVDIDQVVSQTDVGVLQKHLKTITYGNLDREPHVSHVHDSGGSETGQGLPVGSAVTAVVKPLPGITQILAHRWLIL